jgi:cytochrome b561
MFLLQSHPSLSPGLVAFSSFVTQVKRSAFYIIFAELVISGIIVIFVEAKRIISART